MIDMIIRGVGIFALCGCGWYVLAVAWKYVPDALKIGRKEAK